MGKSPSAPDSKVHARFSGRPIEATAANGSDDIGFVGMPSAQSARLSSGGFAGEFAGLPAIDCHILERLGAIVLIVPGVPGTASRFRALERLAAEVADSLSRAGWAVLQVGDSLPAFSPLTGLETARA